MRGRSWGLCFQRGPHGGSPDVAAWRVPPRIPLSLPSLASIVTVYRADLSVSQSRTAAASPQQQRQPQQQQQGQQHQHCFGGYVAVNCLFRGIREAGEERGTPSSPFALQCLFSSLRKGPSGPNSSPAPACPTGAPEGQGADSATPRAERYRGAGAGSSGGHTWVAREPPWASRWPPWAARGPAWASPGAVLAAGAAETARASGGDAAYWGRVALQAAELGSSLSPAELAVLLHALLKTGRCPEDNLRVSVACLAARAETHMQCFNSLQLAQVLSALSRTPVCLGPSLLRAARRRVLTLLAAGGFEQLFEVAMVLNAAVKLRMADTELLDAFAAHVQRLIRRSRLPVRDLAVVAQSFACAAYTNAKLFASVAEEAEKGLGEATVLDMARLLQAFAGAAAQRLYGSPEAEELTPCSTHLQHAAIAPKAAAGAGPSTARCSTSSTSSSNISISTRSSSSSSNSGDCAYGAPHKRLFSACVETVSERIGFASPGELAVAAQACGLALLQCQGKDAEALRTVLQQIRRATVSSLSLLMPQQLGTLLHTFARWSLPFPPRDLLKTIRRLQQFSPAATAPLCTAVAATVGPRAGPADEAGGADPAAAGGFQWHPVLSAVAASVPLDSSTRLSCLHSVGLLLGPCAAAVAQGGTGSALCSSGCPAVQQQPLQQRPGEAQAALSGDSCSSVPTVHAAASHESGKAPVSHEGPRLPGATEGAAEALAAGERLFEDWMAAVFLDLFRRSQQDMSTDRDSRGDGRFSTPPQNASVPAPGVQPVLRIAETLANCRLFPSMRRFLGPLQQLLLQRRAALDPCSAAKLQHLFRALGFEDEDDILLLLQETASSQSSAAAKPAAPPGLGSPERWSREVRHTPS